MAEERVFSLLPGAVAGREKELVFKGPGLEFRLEDGQLGKAPRHNAAGDGDQNQLAPFFISSRRSPGSAGRSKWPIPPSRTVSATTNSGPGVK